MKLKQQTFIIGLTAIFFPGKPNEIQGEGNYSSNRK